LSFTNLEGEIMIISKKAQYRDQTFEIEMFPKAGDAVKRGQVIGLSEYRIIKGSLAF
jgi:hypothetical protein